MNLAPPSALDSHSRVFLAPALRGQRGTAATARAAVRAAGRGLARARRSSDRASDHEADGCFGRMENRDPSTCARRSPAALARRPACLPLCFGGLASLASRLSPGSPHMPLV